MLHFDISLGRMVHGSMPTLHTLNPHQRAFFRPFPLPTFSPSLAQPHLPDLPLPHARRWSTRRAQQRNERLGATGKEKRNYSPCQASAASRLPDKCSPPIPPHYPPRRVRAFDGRTNPARPATGLGRKDARDRTRGSAQPQRDGRL
jgi:hypothetical protein